MYIYIWMNEWCIYIALIVYCHCRTPKALYNHVGGSLLNHHQCAASTWIMRRQPTVQRRQCTHHTPATGGEEERDRANQCERGLLGRPWLIRASGGNLARTPGLHSYSLREVPWDFFSDHWESGPRFNVSSKRRCFLQYSVPVTILGL